MMGAGTVGQVAFREHEEFEGGQEVAGMASS